MNYRHAFHAGNHTEIFKHSVLCLLLSNLCKKAKPFTVLDTHAGAGLYDLSSPESLKTGEAQDGVGRILGKGVPGAETYLRLVDQLNPDGLRQYPGSPMITQSFLREGDRLIACELREDDAALLRANFHRDLRISVHRRDGYEGINAFVPLQSRRGLVFIDPPFEQPDEFERIAKVMNAGIRKWPTGIFAAWYPIKDRTGLVTLQRGYGDENPPTICCEFLREPINGETLAGSGMLICNPPWQIEVALANLCSGLARAFGQGQASWSLDWWIQAR